MLYYYKVNDDTFITHDGYVQLGICHNLEYFLANVKVEYIETHWIPDTFNNRYKRLNYQVHLQQQALIVKEEK